MKFPALVRSIVVRVKGMSAVPSGGWSSGAGWFGVIRESFGGAFQSNITVDAPRDLLAFSGVFAPLTLIAGDFAKCEPCVVEEDADGICTPVRNDPHSAVLRKPNQYQTTLQFMECWSLARSIYGNTYALKVREPVRRIVTKLFILDPQRVTPLVTDEGDVYYRLAADNLSGIGSAITAPASEIIHDRVNCLFHPLMGVPPIYAAGMSATVGRRIQGNSGRFFQNMSRPLGILTSPEKIAPDLAKQYKEQWEANYGGENLGRTAVLGGGLKYEAMAIPADQAQLIQQLEWTVRDIASCFHMPLFKVGGPLPVGSTIDALNQIYYSDCLQLPLESFEACMTEGLELPNGREVECDLEGLLRMDRLAQMQILAEGVKGTIYSPNEARRKINLPKVDGGDSPMAQQQNFSLSALAKRDALPNPFVLDKPTQTPSGEGPPAAADPKQGKGVDLDDDLLDAWADRELRKMLAPTSETATK
jgi:HK97 family phage portal protein